MLERIINWSLNNRILVLIGLAGVIGIGFSSLQKLNIDAFPDTTPVQVQINTAAPALVPEEVERQITFPIEQAISGLPKVEQLRSQLLRRSANYCSHYLSLGRRTRMGWVRRARVTIPEFPARSFE